MKQKYAQRGWAPIKYLVDMLCLLFMIIMLFSIVIIVLLERYIPSNIFFALLTTWGVYVVLNIIFMLTTIPYVRRKQIDFFVEKISAWKEAEYIENILYSNDHNFLLFFYNNHIRFLCINPEIIPDFAITQFLDSNENNELLNTICFDDFEFTDVSIQKIDFTANAFYAPSGSMISVFIDVHCNGVKEIEEHIILSVDGNTLVIMKHFNIEVKRLEEILSNSKINMLKYCKKLGSMHFLE